MKAFDARAVSKSRLIKLPGVLTPAYLDRNGALRWQGKNEPVSLGEALSDKWEPAELKETKTGRCPTCKT